MRKLYVLLENIRDTLVPLIKYYSLDSIYKATMYSIAYTALLKKYNIYETLKPLEEKIPRPLIALAKGKLHYMFLKLFNILDEILNLKKIVVIKGAADLKFLINQLKQEVGRVDQVIIYDCMSLTESLVISAYLQNRGIKSTFLSSILLNPIGLTRFITHQLREMNYHEALRELARLIAKNLNATKYYKKSYFDKIVHKYGLLGIDEFMERMDINSIANEVLSLAVKGRLLIGSDHGYDLVKALKCNYVYVIHGFKPSHKASPILLLSRFAFFLGTY